LKRINTLIKECLRTPFDGIGKPEPLLGDLAGLWSRRIDEKNRLVYEVTDVAITIISCRYHYE
ncbi:txe/YoeB family addiction module toxin, partial [Acinetobacter baumannii LAC-4]|uniref:Txe/YoeB family addiction module toxin n=2 Tax=Acinetobacter TaxID=469 RepID=UPI00044CB5D9